MNNKFKVIGLLLIIIGTVLILYWAMQQISLNQAPASSNANAAPSLITIVNANILDNPVNVGKNLESDSKYGATILDFVYNNYEDNYSPNSYWAIYSVLSSQNSNSVGSSAIKIVSSNNLVNWGSPVTALKSFFSNRYDFDFIESVSLVFKGGTYYLYFVPSQGNVGFYRSKDLFLLTSRDGAHWEFHDKPILESKYDIYLNTAIIKNDMIEIIANTYNDGTFKSPQTLFQSNDGINFTKVYDLTAYSSRYSIYSYNDFFIGIFGVEEQKPLQYETTIDLKLWSASKDFPNPQSVLFYTPNIVHDLSGKLYVSDESTGKIPIANRITTNDPQGTTVWWGITGNIYIKPNEIPVTPSPEIQPVACGKIDVNDDSRLTTVDLSEFLRVYSKSCSDSFTSAVKSCWGKDTNNDHKVNTIDLSSFLHRYNKESCLILQ